MLVHRVPKDLPGPRGIVEAAFPISPAGGGHEQRHRVIFLAVRGGAFRVVLPVQLNGPGKVSRVGAFLHEHITFREHPELIKNVLPVHLDAHHHAVTHALGPGVNVARIHHAPGVLVRPMAEVLRLIEKNRLKSVPDLLSGCFIADSGLRQKVRICPGVKGSLFHGVLPVVRTFQANHITEDICLSSLKFNEIAVTMKSSEINCNTGRDVSPPCVFCSSAMRNRTIRSTP